jgi:hypothetical protein
MSTPADPTLGSYTPGELIIMSSTQTLLAKSSATGLFAAAGVGLLAGQALLPISPSDTAGQIAVAAAHREAELGSAVAFLAAGALLVLGALASNRIELARGRALTRVGLIVTGVGALWPVAGRATFNAILVALTGKGHGGSSVTALHAIGTSGAFAVFLPALLAFFIGPVLLALGLRRAGALPIWPSILWVVGVVTVNAAENQSRAAATIGMALVATALAWIGRGAASIAIPSDGRPDDPFGPTHVGHPHAVLVLTDATDESVGPVRGRDGGAAGAGQSRAGG